MRTKTLLIAAALGVASIASSMAQVYSANAVGYVTLSLGAGFHIIANPLNGTNNSLNTILPLDDAASGTTIFRLNPDNSYTVISFFSEDFGWSAPTPQDLIINPGEGFYIQPAGPLPLNITFVGEVPQGNLAQNIAAGFSMRSSQVPQALALGPNQSAPANDNLDFPASHEDTVYLYNNALSQFDVYNYFEGFGWSGPPGTTPEGPVIPVATGFFVNKAVAQTWDRQFSVN